MELKTSNPGVTKTEQIKMGYSNVNDHSKYLKGKYSYMNMGTTSMQKVSTTVSVSGNFLKKCMNDPDEKIAKENAERKAKEKKAAEEKAAKRRKEKKAEEEKVEEWRAEKKEQMKGTFTVSATGTDIKSVTQIIVASVSGTSSITGDSFSADKESQSKQL